MNMKVILSVILCVYALISLYIYWRGCRAFPKNIFLRFVYASVWAVIVFSYPAARLLIRWYDNVWTENLLFFGSLSLAWVLYAFIGFVLLDLLQIFSLIWVQFMLSLQNFPKRIPKVGPWIVWLGAWLIVANGYWNAHHPIVREYKLALTKKLPQEAPIRIAVVTDVHIGRIIGSREVEGLVDRLNRLNPDLVLFVGDMIDEDIGHIIEKNSGKALENIRSHLGVFAVTGNHEYIHEVDSAVSYLKDLNIRVLRDEPVRIADSIYLVGREDKSRIRFTSQDRVPLEILLQDVDMNFPVVVLDHQPDDWEKAASLGVDMYLSGHTHDGQLWPLNYITQAYYKVTCGYHLIEQMHLYVSAGYGTWGPPVRVGNRPEIVLINLIGSSPRPPLESTPPSTP